MDNAITFFNPLFWISIPHFKTRHCKNCTKYLLDYIMISFILMDKKMIFLKKTVRKT